MRLSQQMKTNWKTDQEVIFIIFNQIYLFQSVFICWAPPEFPQNKELGLECDIIILIILFHVFFLIEKSKATKFTNKLIFIIVKDNLRFKVFFFYYCKYNLQ